MELITSQFRRTDRFEAFIAPAAAQTALWRVLLSILCLGLFILLGGLALGLVGIALTLPQEELRGIFLLTEPWGALLTLGSFVFWVIGLWAALRLLHRRPLASVLSPTGRINWRHYALGAGVAIGVSFIGAALGAMLVGAPVWAARAPLDWCLYVLAAIPLIFMQTAVEEAVFRGYLVQQLAHRFRSPWIWAGVPSLAFGLLHWNPAGYGGSAALVILITGMTGLVFVVATIRTGSLSLAMGLHFGINMHALTMISPGDYASGLAIAHWPTSEETLASLVRLELALLLICALGAAWLFRPSPQDV